MALDSKKEEKSRESAIDVEQLEKHSQIQSEVHANRLQVLEVQQKLSGHELLIDSAIRWAAGNERNIVVI